MFSYFSNFFRQTDTQGTSDEKFIEAIVNNLINTLGLKLEATKSSGPIISKGNYASSLTPDSFYPVCQLSLFEAQSHCKGGHARRALRLASQ